MNDKDIKSSSDANKDTIFASSDFPKRFDFTQDVATVFDNMLERSIPLYLESMKSICWWAQHAIKSDSNVYDIGCSTGTLLKHLAPNINAPRVKYIGIDSSGPMIEKAKVNLKDLENVNLIHEDACHIKFENASLVVSNFTLQFIGLEKRAALLNNISSSLIPGGYFIISEKIEFTNSDSNDLVTAAYDDYKLKNGYSREEIERKRKSLDGVLIPMKWRELLHTLESLGFEDCIPIVQWHNFVTFVCRK